MVAIDSSVWIAYMQGSRGADIQLLDEELAAGTAIFPPIVVTELLSQPGLPDDHRAVVVGLPILEVTEGYWERAAATRANVLARGLRAGLADTLIAQSCIDHALPLVTRDQDFRHFAKHCGLRLIH